MKDTGPDAIAPAASARLAGRAQRREVVADAAALLHRQRAFAQRAEDAVERIVDRAHHEAVEERDAAPGAGAGEDAAAGKETEIRERIGEAALPTPPVASGSAAASARATRAQVASIEGSAAPPGATKR